MTYLYCTARDVRDYLQLRGFIDANSPFSRGQCENLIHQSMGEFERRTEEAYRPILVTDEIHDLEALLSRHRDLWERIVTPRPVHLDHRPIVPFDQARGHSLQVYEGTDATPSVWTEWLDKSHGRDADWWENVNDGIVFVRKAFIPRRNALFRITYEWGFLPTELSGALTDSATTVPVDSTKRYQNAGVIRVGEEYVAYTAKTAATFTGCTRGYYATTAVAHIENDYVMQVPDSVRTLIIKRVSRHFLMNERFIAEAAEGSGAAVAIAEVVSELDKEWERALSGEFSKWSVF